MSESPWVVDVTDHDFGAQVVDRSHDLPVVVDFWADWCGPCRTLGPMLEKLAVEADGDFLLAKVNVDAAQAVAGEFRVSSIPAVFAIRGGRVVDQFVGVLPEAQLREWLRRIEPTPAERLLAEGLASEQSDPQAAEAKFQAALEAADRDLPAAHLALARLMLAQNRLDDGEAQISSLVDRGHNEPEVERLAAEFSLRRAAADSGGVEACRAAVAADPDDLDAQFKLAQALAGAGEHREAMETALALVARDRQGHGEPARELMVELFHKLGSDHELVGEFRRRLSTALY